MKHLGKLALLALAAFASACFAREAQPDDNAEKAVIENIMARRSVRRYTQQPVEREKVQTLLECGINAPNAMNRQSWQVRAVDSAEFLEGVSKAEGENPRRRPGEEGLKNSFYGAPVVIFVACDTAFQASQIDCGLLGENIALAAQAMGLGTCIMGGPIHLLYKPEAAEYLAKLDLPEGYRLLYCIALGYPDESPEAKPRDASKARFVD